MKNLLLVIMLTFSLLKAQTDFEKWSAKEIPYTILSSNDYKYEKTTGFVNTLIKTSQSIYKFLFSDLDGDNCPFYPSCSKFFDESIRTTNILKGTLMFVDRFTRDVNFFKGNTHYPRYVNGKFYDPVINYTLIPQKINYIPPNIIVR